MAIENPPALLITDGEMRTMHGPELIRELRKVPATASVPIILCSGNTGLAEVATSLGVPFFVDAHVPVERIGDTLGAQGPREGGHGRVERLRAEGGDVTRPN
jgi:CheY-like chemotaxis protein